MCIYIGSIRSPRLISVLLRTARPSCTYVFIYICIHTRTQTHTEPLRTVRPSSPLTSACATSCLYLCISAYLCIPTAHVVSAQDGATKLSVDICMCNKLALFNSQLIKAYTSFDVRVKQLCFVVKRSEHTYIWIYL